MLNEELIAMLITLNRNRFWIDFKIILDRYIVGEENVWSFVEFWVWFLLKFESNKADQPENQEMNPRMVWKPDKLT